MDFIEFHNEMNQYYYRANCYHGIKDPRQDSTSGNHHVINATYHLIMDKLGGYTYSFNEPSLERQDRSTEIAFLDSTKVVYGLYNRHPDKVEDLESHDDYIGIAVSSKILYIQNGASRYGETHWWYYDNLLTGPYKFTNWFGRFPGFKAVVKRGCMEPITILNRAGFIVDIFWGLIFPQPKTDVSGRILQWLKNRVMRGESKVVDWAIDKWEANIKKQYPGQMGEVLGIYYGYDHPFSRAMWEKM